MRSRSIVQHPMRLGVPCDDALSEIKECERRSCGGPQAVDCLLGDWEDWHQCDKCDGERKRDRKVLTHAAHGGRGCEAFTSEETTRCPRTCNQERFCAWETWGSWGICSTTCGSGGKRQRTRDLHLSETPPHDFWEAPQPSGDVMAMRSLTDNQSYILQHYETLTQEVQEMEEQHVRELAIAFSGGCVCLLVGMAVFRGARGRRQPQESSHLRGLLAA